MMAAVYLPGIGPKIKQLRGQKNISQVDLAKQLGVSKSVISSYENEIHLPPYDILLKMARLFGVSTDYLLGSTGNHCVNVDWLTEQQVEAITAIVDELKKIKQIEGRPLDDPAAFRFCSFSSPPRSYRKRPRLLFKRILLQSFTAARVLKKAKEARRYPAK